MSRKLIIVRKNSFLFRGKEYSFMDIDEIISLLYSSIIVIILEEEIYSKYIYEKINKIKLKILVENKIHKEFPQNGDILYDYEQSKINNTIAIYSLKCGNRIEKISKKAKNLEIKPMQYIIKSCMEKFLKNKKVDFKILLNFNEYYYYVSVNQGLFCYGFVEKEEKIVINRIMESEQQGKIYIDSSINSDISLKEKFELVKINIGDLLNEKVYKKQKLSS